jgi:hypothetical protein
LHGPELLSTEAHLPMGASDVASYGAGGTDGGEVMGLGASAMVSSC